jgi:acyl-CoA dehydrogenase
MLPLIRAPGPRDDRREAFREGVRAFVAREITPHRDRWEEGGIVGREVWAAAGRHRLLGLPVQRELGGGGIDDPGYGVVLTQELATAGAAGWGLTLHNDVVGPYLRELTTPEQKRRWLPGFCSGEIVTAFATVEPGAAGDLRQIRTAATTPPYGDGWILNGHKACVGNGITADLVVVLARTGGDAGARAASLLVVERGMPGFARSRNTPGIGPRARDTADLFFTGVPVPRANLLGDEGGGFGHVLRNQPAERLSIATAALASAESVLGLTVDHLGERARKGRPAWSPEHVRLTLAELVTELDIGRTFVDRCRREPGLDAPTAAMAGWWCTDLHRKVVDRCLQLHAGSLDDQPLAQACLDAWSPTPGTAELMETVAGELWP